MDARCQCGAVRFTTPLPQPLALYICHCADCRRQTGSAFGTSAIFPRFKLPDAELLGCYSRPVASGHTLYCYFCRNCGTRLFHTTPTKNVVSVKGGCLEGLDWSKAIHIWAKNAMVPIPEGSETHSEESEFTAYEASATSASGQSSSGDGTQLGEGEKLDQPGLLTGSGSCELPSGKWEKVLEEMDKEAGEGKAKMKGACELSG